MNLMVSRMPTHVRNTFLLPMLIAVLLSACASGPNKNAELFDTSAVKLIQLDVETIDRQALGVSASDEDVTEQVRKNLTEWGYPIDIDDGKTYTHILKARVEPIEHDAPTPTGFSFSSGNSDPRSPEFQKADVLPVSCEITSIEHPGQSEMLTMSFSAEVMPWAGKESRYVITSDKLVDRVSTVCFNLLNDLKWPDKTSNLAIPVIKPSWIPEIRIETLEESTEAIKEIDKKEVDKKENLKSAPESSVTKEGRRQIIIHNQGSPVIIKFGHDRK